MGNHPSGAESQGGANGTQGAPRPSLMGGDGRQASGIRHMLRNNGALGLSKAELDARCQPSGIHQPTAWDPKHVRRLIGDGRLAARWKGAEDRQSDRDQECPICFWYYPQVNQTRCCQAVICTDCYLQVRHPKEPNSTCPFCNQKLSVCVAAALTQQNVEEKKMEEQKLIEAQIRAQKCQNESSTPHSSMKVDPNAAGSLPSLSEKAPQAASFGASLEQNQRAALLRARSSLSTADAPNAKATESSTVKAVAMTPEERRALEAEMKAQHHHPLAQRLQQEEEERRVRHDVSYYNSPQYQQRMMEQVSRQQQMRRHHSEFLHLAGAHNGRRRTRDWNRIVQAFEAGGHGSAVQSLDDLVVLEAAIMLSMEEASRNQSGNGNADGNNVGEDADAFAARHARAGFPLARARVSDPSVSASTSSLEPLLASSGRRTRSAAAAAWAMMQMSEEEQLAMAIAASLEESRNQANNPENSNSSEPAAPVATSAPATAEAATTTDTAASPEEVVTQPVENETLDVEPGTAVADTEVAAQGAVVDMGAEETESSTAVTSARAGEATNEEELTPSSPETEPAVTAAANDAETSTDADNNS